MIEQVILGDPAWSDTFAHRVAPRPDEWLVSVLLRCDEVNHWESGETFRYLLRSTNHSGFGPRSSLIVVPWSILECLSHVLMLPPQRLLATTYSAELARLSPYGEPTPGQLLGLQSTPESAVWRRRLGQRAIALERKIHLCPACVAQTRTIRRTVTLPHLQYCPIHHVAFRERCLCGRPLIFFFRGTQPFRCYACGLDWARWPQRAIPADRVAQEQALFALYEFFLLKGTDELKTFASRLARRALKEHEFFELKLTGRRLKNLATRPLDRLSLGYLVDVLVSVGIAPKDIADGKV